MYSVSKDFHFSASHKLSGLPVDHPCSRLHGHNYVVKVTVYCSTLNGPGFVVDYRDMDRFKAWLDETVDHRHLNDLTQHTNPTAENLAEYFFKAARLYIPGIPPTASVAVSVSETDKTWATYEEEALLGEPE